ncbi:MAG TPA: STAS domain-containing protein [Bryobacteraceae bacterium]|jgi:anti-sigma B factor antagonist|nr:STAS domain-containing protein [Bryobacteraceae bacterium]
MSTEFSKREVAPDITVLEIGGRLHTGTTLRSIEFSVRKLLEDGCRKLVLDLSKADFVDSSGVGMLIVSAAQMKKLGGSMRIAGAQTRVAELFEIVHLAQVAELSPDVATACNELQTA